MYIPSSYTTVTITCCTGWNTYYLTSELWTLHNLWTLNPTTVDMMVVFPWLKLLGSIWHPLGYKREWEGGGWSEEDQSRDRLAVSSQQRETEADITPSHRPVKTHHTAINHSSGLSLSSVFYYAHCLVFEGIPSKPLCLQNVLLHGSIPKLSSKAGQWPGNEANYLYRVCIHYYPYKKVLWVLLSICVRWITHRTVVPTTLL